MPRSKRRKGSDGKPVSGKGASGKKMFNAAPRKLYYDPGAHPRPQAPKPAKVYRPRGQRGR